MWDNPARASEGGGEGAPGTRIEIALQTIVQGGADMHGQPVQSDVFPFLFLQEVKKTTKPKTHIKIIIFLLTVNTEPQVNLCQGFNGLREPREFYLCFRFSFFLWGPYYFYLQRIGVFKCWRKTSLHNVVDLQDNFTLFDLVLQTVWCYGILGNQDFSAF